MRIAVTGGAGFIGGHVVDHLIDRGHEPVIFDHAGRRPHHPDVEVMLGDTRDDVAVSELAAHAEGIIHLASVLGTQETVGNPRPAVMTNILSGLNVLEAATQYGLPVVNICVGNAGMPNPYSASKTCVESLAVMFLRDRGTRVNQVRAVNAYGPRQVPAAPYASNRVRKITPAFACRALTGDPVEVYGDGLQVSDMVHVTDVARTLVSALESAARGVCRERVTEVGPSEHHTVLDVARLVIDAAHDLGYGRSGVRHLPMRPGETPGASVTVDNESLRQVGVDPASLVPLREGISDAVAWYAAHWLPGWLDGHR